MRAGASFGRPARAAKKSRGWGSKVRTQGAELAMPSLVDQQRQHGLVAAVHAVEAADRQGAGRRDAGVMNTAKDLHGRDYCGREVLDGRA